MNFYEVEGVIEFEFGDTEIWKESDIEADSPEHAEQIYLDRIADHLETFGAQVLSIDVVAQ